MNTSITTVLAVLVLYLVGSPAIKDFTLALLIGLTVGTYSSLFMAPPLWTLWKSGEERKGRPGKPVPAGNN